MQQFILSFAGRNVRISKFYQQCIKCDIYLCLCNMQMAAVITGSDDGNPVTSLISSDSFVFTLQVLHCCDETKHDINLSLHFCT